MKEELKVKDAHTSYLYWFNKNGKKYSVLDCGDLMRRDKEHDWEKMGIFMGWEAFEINSDGDMMPETQVRADTWEELEKLI